ncbi:MAG TPA: hypothetical protein VFA04_01470 [Bryobacteraceae bacterium]|jgi:hypothetical protein|nr:hypothetical protein [Bryobacteraceae bacterium]
MTLLTGILRLCWTLSCGAAAFALFRSFQLRLHRAYPAFTTFLIVIVAQYLALVWLKVTSDTYRIVWMYCEPVIGLGLAAMAVEAWVRLTGTLPVDRHLWAMIGSGLMALGVIVSLLSSELDNAWWDGALQFAIWSRRYLASTFAVGLAAAAIIARTLGARFGNAAARNVRLHVILLIIYLFVTSSGFIVINARSGQSSGIIDIAMSLLFGAVFAFWGVGMKSEADPPEETVPNPAAAAI